MKRIEIPESAILAGIWVVWTFLAIGSLGWAMLVLLDHFGVKNQAAAWVQAVGSVGAIFVAIGVAYHGQRTTALQRLAEAAARESARAERLYWLIWEAVHVTRQLKVMATSHPDMQLGHETTDFYVRILTRAQLNLDDDMNVERHEIASNFRIALASLLHRLQQHVVGDAGRELKYDVDRALTKLENFLDLANCQRQPRGSET